MEDIIVFGSGGHAKVVIDTIEQQNMVNIIGIYTDTTSEQGKLISGYKVLGKIDGDFICSSGIVAIGDNYGRKSVVERILSFNAEFNFINAIHPNAILAKDVVVGKGTVIVGGATLNTSATIGDHSIVNTNSSIDHDAVVGSFSTVSPGVSLGGNVSIGNLTTIGIGSNIVHKKHIGDGVLIGAGSTVISDIPSEVLVYGTPARIIRKRKVDEKFL